MRITFAFAIVGTQYTDNRIAYRHFGFFQMDITQIT